MAVRSWWKTFELNFSEEEMRKIDGMRIRQRVVFLAHLSQCAQVYLSSEVVDREPGVTKIDGVQ